MGDELDQIGTSLDPPLVIVTVAAGSEHAGCLVGFHTQSSIDPVRYSVWLSKANHTYRVALRASHLAVHYLTAGDLELARLFGTRSGDDIDKFAGLRIADGPGRVPMLLDRPHAIVVRLTALLDERGDHVCAVGEVVDERSAGPFEPLRLSAAAGFTPGHANEERPSPPTERAAD